MRTMTIAKSLDTSQRAAVAFVMFLIYSQTILAANDNAGGGIDAEDKQIGLYQKSYALVIGIDDYTNGWPRLSNAVSDAKIIAEQLGKSGYAVDLALNLDGKKLKEALRDFFIVRGAEPDARLLLWFAGHGQTIKGEGFLVAKDTPNQEDPSFKLSAIHMRDFGSWVRLAESKHVLAIFDSCFSGTIFSSQRGKPPATIDKAVTFPVRQFITSGDANQLVLDNGTFRELFVRALQGDEPADINTDGYLTASELGFFLSDRVTNLTQAQQTPRYGKLRDAYYDRGDFILTMIEKHRDNIKETTKLQSVEIENVYWESALKIDSKLAYSSYIQRYPNGIFKQLAEAKLQELTKRAEHETSKEDTRSSQKPVQTLSIVAPSDLTRYAVINTTAYPSPNNRSSGTAINSGEKLQVVGETYIGGAKWLKIQQFESELFILAKETTSKSPSKSMAQLLREARAKKRSYTDPALDESTINSEQYKKRSCIKNCRGYAYFTMDDKTRNDAENTCTTKDESKVESCLEKAEKTWQAKNKLDCEQRC